MNASDLSTPRTGLTRWAARILGVMAASFLLLMFAGYYVEGRAPSYGSLEPFAALSLLLMGIYCVSLFLALKWERTGALLAVIALGLFYVIMFMGVLPGNVSGGFSARGVLSPIFLALWLPPLLYLACWWIEASRLRSP